MRLVLRVIETCLYSDSADKFYIGLTSDKPNIRLDNHLSDFYKKPKFTNIASDWKIFWILQCPDILTARKIEKHIKKMKSRKYIQNLTPFYLFKIIRSFFSKIYFFHPINNFVP